MIFCRIPQTIQNYSDRSENIENIENNTMQQPGRGGYLPPYPGGQAQMNAVSS